MSYEIKVYHSPMYELLCSFLIYSTRKWTENLDWSNEWLDEVTQQLDPDLVQRIEKIHTWELTDYDILYLWTVLRDPYTDVESCLTYLEETPMEELYEIALPYITDVTLSEATRIRDGYIPLLRAWNTQYFVGIEHTLIPLLEEDAAEKRLLSSKMEPQDLVEYATNGVVIEPHEDIHTIVIMPMIHCRPVNYYSRYQGMFIIQYAIDIPETNEDQVPTGLTRFTRALSDEKRLRILRYLAHDLRTTSDIANMMQMTPEAVSSNIRTLRAAGLLRTHLNDSNERFSIRLDGVAEMQLFLESYLRL
ncbi:hypothetical protein BVG16_23000 [Paenibacillus selenitireducens]|uniref:HTH arsR-type domain-containing protein n=1 Tax=Paenibacillus selenitireducens TaxID=1324314 RepID=A0A1T2X402_9BACL|nr:ArsR family transcriptional regulator [Paenibacillus selenitireducens]OPA74631.1 hypothetical protein BVG16_23000 [Paenibacillus selenitireducens]